MFKIVITRTNAHKADGDVETLEVDATIVRRVGHAIRKAPTEHRYITFAIFAACWAVLEFVLHYEATAHTVEIFGVVPFADRAAKVFFGE
jgi:hypothetical protein